MPGRRGHDVRMCPNRLGPTEYQRDEEPELPGSPGQDLPAAARDRQPEPRQHSSEPEIRSAAALLAEFRLAIPLASRIGRYGAPSRPARCWKRGA